MKGEQTQPAEHGMVSLLMDKPYVDDRCMTLEPFVCADEAACFLAVNRRYLLALARKGIAGAYPLGTGMRRKTWVFRLSELAAAVAGKKQQ